MTNDSAQPIKTAESDRSKPIGIDPAAYEGDIVSRLRHWRGLHLAHTGELFEAAADEIERLLEAGGRLESQMIAACRERDRLRLTDAERAAIEWASRAADPDYTGHTATLRGLLARCAIGHQ